MPEPIVFPSTTSHLSLPLLFAGQAQKEPFINQALSVIDALMFGTVNDSLSVPPIEPPAGSSFRILANATAEWSGHDDEIALWIGNAWEFVPPREGATIFDQTAAIRLRFAGAWETATEPTEPTGGTTVDVEARATIAALIGALRTAGIFENPS